MEIEQRLRKHMANEIRLARDNAAMLAALKEVADRCGRNALYAMKNDEAKAMVEFEKIENIARAVIAQAEKESS